jgi:hypothetical protein
MSCQMADCTRILRLCSATHHTGRYNKILAPDGCSLRGRVAMRALRRLVERWPELQKGGAAAQRDDAAHGVRCLG